MVLQLWWGHEHKGGTIRVLTKLFDDIKFQHIPRAHNGVADALSKRALKEEAGRLIIFHSDDGVDSHMSILNIF
jgi:hypothetical protein